MIPRLRFGRDDRDEDEDDDEDDDDDEFDAIVTPILIRRQCRSSEILHFSFFFVSCQNTAQGN